MNLKPTPATFHFSEGACSRKEVSGIKPVKPYMALPASELPADRSSQLIGSGSPPQLSLDLFVGVPDGTGLLEAVHRLLHVVVAKLPEDGDKVATLRRPVQRMDGRAEGCGEK
ncbi:hypothetical protein EYF80_012439 [Liparis tanakae]|uniref:Uncharacterized protein n=1 Tax=Liparis tanakae TaxID=230148 RepID=A0A4Z2II14_9TELE|nr:hypothetical protein EYF80_012439 [Liparis tanakae]